MAERVEDLFARGVTLLMSMRPAEALADFDRVLALAPGHADALSNRGLALLDLRRPPEALASFDLALRAAPGHLDALVNRGGALLMLGRPADALASFRAALALAPDHAAVHGDVAGTLRAAGALDGAAVHHRRLVALRPFDPAAQDELGNTLRLEGDIVGAFVSYRRSLAIEPSGAGAFGNLGYAWLAGGEPAVALVVARRAFALRPSREIATLIAKCLDEPIPIPVDLRGLIGRLLAERWTRPGRLAAVALHIVQAGPEMAQAMAAPALSAPMIRPLAQDALLRHVLTLSPVQGIELEQFFTRVRAWQISAPDGSGDLLAFLAALARQCFLNEYVFAVSAQESAVLDARCRSLAAAFATDAPIPPRDVLAVAAYIPLHALPGSERLLDRAWPAEVDVVLTQQVREPLAEAEEARSVPRLTPISAGVSQAVQAQYEENPYPRWADTVSPGEPMDVGTYLRQVFPLSPFRPAGEEANDILIAGCGTGQQAIETAAAFRHRSVLAVDLSRASLAYAKRKTREAGGISIEYAQADIMALGSLDRRFDHIEASGVLHHLADPFAGWRVLLSLLKPNGVMRIGLYSALARRDIVAARSFIAAHGYAASPAAIRAFRQELLSRDDLTWARSIVESGDFATLSACRDLLFHVQENHLSLPEIARFLADEGLRFIGFETSLSVRSSYAARFPGDGAMIDLPFWHRFETENPDIFRGMYQFWVQKP